MEVGHLIQQDVGQPCAGYLYEELSKVRVILVGVIFIRSHLSRSYLDRDDEPTISLIGYEPTGLKLPL